MNQRRSRGIIARAARDYVESVRVPAVDVPRILARVPSAMTRSRAIEARGRSRMFVSSFAALAALLLLCSNIPAVVAGVEVMLHSFRIVDGRAIANRTFPVTLERARADVPFAVIAPPPIAGFTPAEIEETSENDPGERSLFFRYLDASDGRSLMIHETAAATRASMEVVIGRGAPGRRLPLPPPGTPAMRLEGRLGDATFVPLTWVVRGTRVVLASPPGLVSAARLRAIERAMSR